MKYLNDSILLHEMQSKNYRPNCISFNTGHKYCKMLQGILDFFIFIKLPFVIKIFGFFFYFAQFLP